MGRKIEPIRPGKLVLVDYCSKILEILQIFRPVIRARLSKASSPILNFESPKKP
jgi:hypothetical protein